MVIAYIFVITKPGSKEYLSKETILKMKGVKDFAEVYGEYDMVLKVVLPNMDDLQKFILNLRKIKGIEKTVTMIGVKG